MTIQDTDIEALAASPKKAVTDEGSVEERSVQDLIDAKKYIDGQGAADRPLFGLRVAKCKPGGAA